MRILPSGANIALAPGSGPLDIAIEWQPARLGSIELDASAFILEESGRVGSDADFVFYNQPQALQQAVSLRPGEGRSAFTVALDRVPPRVQRVAFALTIHGAATFAALTQVSIAVGGQARFAPATSGMREAALVLGELYRRAGQWKFRALGQGFFGGLGPLARHFGVEVSDDGGSAAPPPAATPRPQPPVSPPALDLEKKVAAAAPRLVNLAKAAKVSLQKRRLMDVVARVALVLDASGSMLEMYRRGMVQRVVDRVMPLAVHFDDNGELEVWAFSQQCEALPPVTLATLDAYVERTGGGWQQWMSRLNAAINYEPAAIRDVVAYYYPDHPVARQVVKRARGIMGLFGMNAPLDAPLHRPTRPPRPETEPPVYVIFISDGGVGSDAEIERLLIESSDLPVFWQFVGIGGANYGILERFDTMSGRYVDNANFFALDDLDAVSEGALYDRLLGEFPDWLKAARAGGLIA